ERAVMAGRTLAFLLPRGGVGLQELQAAFRCGLGLRRFSGLCARNREEGKGDGNGARHGDAPSGSLTAASLHGSPAKCHLSDKLIRTQRGFPCTSRWPGGCSSRLTNGCSGNSST